MCVPWSSAINNKNSLKTWVIVWGNPKQTLVKFQAKSNKPAAPSGGNKWEVDSRSGKKCPSGSLEMCIEFNVVFIFYYTTYIPRSIFLFITIKKFFINRILFIWCFWSAFGPTMPPATGQALGICLAPVALGFWALMLLCSKLRYLVPFQMFFYLPFPSTVEICCLKPHFSEVLCAWCTFGTRRHFLILRKTLHMSAWLPWSFNPIQFFSLLTSF